VDGRDCLSPRVYREVASASVPFEVLEDGLTEPKNPVGSVGRSHGRRCLAGAKHAADAAIEQLVLVAEVREDVDVLQTDRAALPPPPLRSAKPIRTTAPLAGTIMRC
jgi:hypothetical protein